MVWWTTLSAISLANLAAWGVMAAVVTRRPGPLDGRRAGAPGWQLWLSLLFVVGCAFRSFLPRAEGQRICLYDSWISSAMIGRWVATVAELSLVAQWTLLLARWARTARASATAWMARLLLPLIAIAELFSWYTTLTTNFVGSVCEESIWAVTGTLLIGAMLWLRPRYQGRQRRFIAAAIALNVAYVVFMWTVDVPMYWSRWTADQQAGRAYLSLGQGWRDAQLRRVLTRRWVDWRDEVPWMSLYFSVGVWISIALVRADHVEKETSDRPGRGMMIRSARTPRPDPPAPDRPDAAGG
jgi:hypothetical protein